MSETSSHKCKYYLEYHSYEKNSVTEYFCHRDALDSGYCFFHDPNFLTDQTRNFVLDMFMKELEGAIISGIELICIGYHLPKIDLTNCFFSHGVYFINTKFKNEVNFSNVEFYNVSFKNAEFSDEIYFNKIKVIHNFDFSQTKNNAKSIFDNVQILEESDFSKICFDELDFNKCELNFPTFRYSLFNKTTKFLESIFSEKTDFRATKFHNITEFSESIFKNSCDFRDTKFESVVRFNHIDFEQQKSVYFNDNLSNVSFKNTDISRIIFDEKVIWGEEDRYSILDERELIENPETANLTSVLAIYRNLRENYEFRLMYEEAGQCFIKEMELKRVYFEDKKDGYTTKIKKDRGYFSLTNCYNVSCEYGESFKRISSWILLIFVGAGVYFFCNPYIDYLENTKPFGNIDYSSKIAGDFVFRIGISVNMIFDSFFQASSNDLVQNFVRVSGLTVLGMLFLVLRRKFERRFRH